MSDRPAAVFVSGDRSALNRRTIAIVGTRRASARGLAVANRLAGDLARHGWTVVSGLALGIDGAAHQGALAAGGATVAIMATGLNVTYPAAHAHLRSRIERSGCVVSEYPADSHPTRYRFPQRNRLIAGLAEGVIVAEAPRRSGALITGQFAADLGREVFAVPGPVDEVRYRGCHHLLRDGATLVESVADVTAVLGCPDPTAAGNAGEPVLIPQAGTAAHWILDRIDLDGTLRDALRDRWPGTEAAWAEGLLALETTGLIRRLPGGRLARKLWTP